MDDREYWSHVRRTFASALLLMAAACDDYDDWPMSPTEDCSSPEVDELPFDPAAIRTLVNGHHEVMLRWRGPGSDELPSAARDEKLRIDIAQVGTAQVTTRCGGMMRFDVKVDVALASDRRATFRGTAYGSRNGGQVFARAAASAADKLAFPGPAILGYSQPNTAFSMWISDQSTRGSLMSDTESVPQCERARWPVDRVCDGPEEEAAFATRFGKLEFADLMDDLAALETQTLHWKDGSESRVTITFEQTEAPICVGPESIEGSSMPGRTLRTHWTAHVKTDDERLDLSVPAEISVQWSPKKQGVVVVPGDRAFTIDHTIMVRADTTGRGLFREDRESDDASNFQSVGFSAMLGPGGISGSLEMHGLVVDTELPQIALSGAIERGSLDGVCTEGAVRVIEGQSAKFGIELTGTRFR